jgi:hypothetical protein
MSHYKANKKSGNAVYALGALITLLTFHDRVNLSASEGSLQTPNFDTKM